MLSAFDLDTADDDEDVDASQSALEQARTEANVSRHIARFLATGEPFAPLLRHEHAAFLWAAVERGAGVSAALDALQTWLCYWCLHALDLLGDFDSDSLRRERMSVRLAAHLALRQHADGGFCGFPCDALPHLASTYAAVNALVVLGSSVSLGAIDRRGMLRFLLARKCARSGGFSMHTDGEVDVRGVYCALSIAALLNIATPALLDGAAAFLVSCQSYEGGISGTPGSEAHGGYSFCGLAAALLIEQLRAALGLAPDAHALDYERLLHWVVQRQMPVEGGFQGRTNKLVDSCYSWWQGAVVALLHRRLRIGGDALLCNAATLQAYVFVCCQEEDGGLFDKPGRDADFYHTCYALSGVAAIQWGTGARQVWGDADVNGLPDIDLLHGVRSERARFAKEFFAAQAPVVL